MTETMLAGRLHVEARELRMEEVPVPEPGPGQVLVKVGAAGVCLSDVHLIDGTLRPPFLDGDVVTLGHEVAGTVVALGAGVAGWQTGERVLLQAGETDADGRILTRGVDYDGGWAEYTLAGVGTLVRIPDSLPFEQACFIPDAVSTPFSAIRDSGMVRVGESAGVWGVGGLGAHAVQLLRLAGAAPVVAVDPLPAARERALDLGADLALDPADEELRKKVFAATGRRGLDAAFDFAGVAAVRDQAASVLARGTVGRRGGRLVLVGMTNQPLAIQDGTAFTAAQRSVVGSYGSVPQDVDDLVKLVRAGRLDLARSVSGEFPLAEAPAAVEALEHKVGNPIRLVLKP